MRSVEEPRSRRRPPPIRSVKFEAELYQGHKGITAIHVPFDPEETWGQAPTPLVPRRGGWLVSGTIDGARFEGWIGLMYRQVFLIVSPEVRRKAKVEVGDNLRVVLRPTRSARALAIAREQALTTLHRQ